MLSDADPADLLTFLTSSTRPDLKGRATDYLLGLSGHRDGCRFLRSRPELLGAVLALTSDPAVARDCFHVLVNLSADEALHQVLVDRLHVLPALLRNLQDPGCAFADHVCSILSNLSRRPDTCRTVLEVLQQELGLLELLEIFCSQNFNPDAQLHHLGPLLSNLSQLPEARTLLLDRDRCVIQRLLPFTQYRASVVRRRGVIGTLRNCCFDHTHHQWLLSDAVDILPFLLLPLAGPEELSEEENEGLPVDLQYLPEDKRREEDPDIRKMLLETLLLLMATKAGRRTLRDKSVYPIVREFHRWEKDVHVGAVCEKLVQVLIGDEPEEGMENLMEVEIPEDVEEKLKEADAKELEELQKEEGERQEEPLETRSPCAPPSGAPRLQINVSGRRC